MRMDAKWHASWIRLLPASSADEKMRNLEAAELLEQLEAENERLLNSYDAALCETADMHSISKEAEAQVPRWISVEERLPENGSMSICKTLFWCDILQFDAKTKQWFGPHSIHGKGFVTHWMPLPEALKEDAHAPQD